MINDIDQKKLDIEIYDAVLKLEKFVSLNLLGNFSLNSDISNDYFQTIITLLDTLENIDGLVLYEKQIKRIFIKWTWVVNSYKEKNNNMEFVIEDNINSIDALLNKIISHLEEEQAIPRGYVSEEDLSKSFKELQSKIFELQNRRDELNQLSVDDFYTVEKQLSSFEDKNINFVREKLERQSKSWSALSKTYESLSDENKNFLYINLFNLIGEMFSEILNSVDEEGGIFQNVKLDESVLVEIENEINQFDEYVTNVFFEKKTYKLQIPMTDGHSAYKLVDGVDLIGGNIITYLSEDKYYNQNRKPIESGKIHPVNLKFHNDKVFWDELDKRGLLEKRNGKVCVIDITPEVMNDFDCAFELSKEETIRIETGESIKNIKYIAIKRKLYDKDKDPVNINQSYFDEISIDNEFISFKYDDEKYKFNLAKKCPSSTMSRKKMDDREYNDLKNELEQKYQKFESRITEYTSKLDDQSEEYYRLKDILANLESSRKRYMQ